MRDRIYIGRVFIGIKMSRKDIDCLKELLLLLGGERFQVDWFLEKELEPAMTELLTEHGEILDGREAAMERMGRSSCHENVMQLAKKDGYSAWFGLALSDDGIWRVHSWAIKEGGRVVETTEPRDIYYGLRVG